MKKYQVNFITKEIIATKKFLKQAEMFGSPEYRELIEVMKDLPNFTVRAREIYRPCNCVSYKGLTYDYMRRYLEENNVEQLEMFESLREIGYKYFEIKGWFLSVCAENNNNLETYLSAA